MVCIICLTKFEQLEDMKTHMKHHRELDPHNSPKLRRLCVCGNRLYWKFGTKEPICKKCFKRKLVKNRESEVWICKHCGVVFLKYTRYLAHKKRGCFHKESIIYQCKDSHCGRLFKWKKNANNRDVHTKNCTNHVPLLRKLKWSSSRGQAKSKNFEYNVFFDSIVKFII